MESTLTLILHKILPHERALGKRFGRAECGTIAVMFALILPILFGMVGLGLEAGMWFNQRRELQTIADAAVVSAAIENSYGANSATITAAATLEANNNGLKATTDVITYVGTPTSGAYLGDTSYIEVTMSRQLSTVLSQVFHNFNPSTTVRAVATTGSLSTGEACILALDTTGPALSVSGNGSVILDDCEVASNSTASNALSVSGSGGLTVDCYSVVGDISATAGLITTAECTGATGAPPLADPYATLTDPDNGVCDNSGNLTITSNTTLTGTEADPYVICGNLWAKSGTLTIDGLIVIKGDLKSNGTGSINSGINGSTIVLKDGGRINNINGTSTVNLTAPPAGVGGAWEGILFYQDRVTTPSCTGPTCTSTLNGNTATSFEGVVYFPNQTVEFTGGNSSADHACLQIVASRVSFSGNANVEIDNDCDAAGVDSIEVPSSYYAKLVE
ncbi:MAG: pilus assembly protein [Magnetovibrio sp.]|nr:pilus assembly protein [Magnetovibrio sp.]